MSRKLPLCAWCGGSLASRGRITLDYGDLPESPMVGWHAYDALKCAQQDPCFRACTEAVANGGDAPNALLVIGERGEGRVRRMGGGR